MRNWPDYGVFFVFHFVYEDTWAFGKLWGQEFFTDDVRITRRSRYELHQISAFPPFLADAFAAIYTLAKLKNRTFEI